MIDTYTRLLESAAISGDKKAAEEAVMKLVAHLKSEGRLKMLPEILGELRKLASRRAALAPIVEAASEAEIASALREAAAEGISAREAKVNPSLIRGWRAREGGKLVDRSGKRALADIYQKVIAY